MAKEAGILPMASQMTIGHTLFNFFAEPEKIYELERNYRIDDNIMKFIVVRQDELEYDESADEEEEY